MNLTNLTSSQGIYDISVYANNSSGGILFNGFIIIFVLILFLAFLKSGTLKAGLTASWIGFVLGALLLSMGLVSVFTLILLLLMAAIFTFFVFQDGM